MTSTRRATPFADGVAPIAPPGAGRRAPEGKTKAQPVIRLRSPPGRLGRGPPRAAAGLRRTLRAVRPLGLAGAELLANALAGVPRIQRGLLGLVHHLVHCWNVALVLPSIVSISEFPALIAAFCRSNEAFNVISALAAHASTKLRLMVTPRSAVLRAAAVVSSARRLDASIVAKVVLGVLCLTIGWSSLCFR